VRSCLRNLEDLSAGAEPLNQARFEQKFLEIARTLAQAAEILNALPARYCDLDSAAYEARAESLRRYFSHTPDISSRFTLVMNFFRDTAGFVSLSEVTPLLAQTIGVRKEDAQESARRKLERFKDCGLLEVTRANGAWSYKITDEARFLINRGDFASMGVHPKE